jgi:uncharacterized protein YidB (DUF937 family)
MSSVMSLLGGQGGLQNLIGKFDAKGIGDIIGSWVGTGQNKSISADQIQNVIGSDALSGIASKLGINVMICPDNFQIFCPALLIN